jgi:iron complex outermembrane receptor protein
LFQFNDGARATLRAAWLLPFLFFSTAATAADEPAETYSDTFSTVLIKGQKDGVQPSAPVADKGSPQSVVGEEVIRQIASPVGDYGTVANFTPSFVSSVPNGPGFDAAKGQSLRGFADGQFNVTMDGIPFADPDTFGHHSTSYFPTSVLQQLVIDRSPGGAPDLGYASFGGSVNLYSETIPEEARARAFATFGSFDTGLIGATLNTAAPRESGQTGVIATLEYSQSDGALTYSAGYKDDIFLKSVTLLGDARLTAVYTYDRYRFYNPGNITTADLAAIGSSFGYNNDPTSPNYYRYSSTARSADFGYLKLEAQLTEAWSLEDKVYTYSYRNDGDSLKGDQTSSPIGSGFAGIAPTDIAGRLTVEDYRVVGNDIRIGYSNRYGTFLLGLWAEHSWQTESRVGVDLSTGLLYNVNKTAHSPVYFDFGSHLDTIQPYAQFAWQPIDPLKVRFGVRYRDVKRGFDASVVQNYLPGTAGTVSRSVNSTLPSVDATYRVAENTNILAQVSKGSLIPSQAFFYTANPAAGNQAEPETALAYQLGVVHQTAAYGFGLDAYDIKFDNYVSTVVQHGETLYVSSGSVLYRGVEAEGHVVLGAGVTAVANASLLRATFQQSGMTSSIQHSGDTIPFTPHHTGLAGLMYAQGPWSASLLAKFVGTEYQGKNGSADGTTYKVKPYSYTNATATRNLTGLPGIQNLRLTLGINNLWNSHAVTDNAGYTAAGPSGPNFVNVLARTNYTLSAVADF